MRTFVLRILVDETHPGALRGVLRSVVDGEERTFDNQQSLLDLIRTLCTERDHAPARPGQENAGKKA